MCPQLRQGSKHCDGGQGGTNAGQEKEGKGAGLRGLGRERRPKPGELFCGLTLSPIGTAAIASLGRGAPHGATVLVCSFFNSCFPRGGLGKFRRQRAPGLQGGSVEGRGSDLLLLIGSVSFVEGALWGGLISSLVFFAPSPVGYNTTVIRFLDGRRAS